MLDARNRDDGKTFFATNEPKPFVGFTLDAHRFDRNAKGKTQTFANCAPVRKDFRQLCNYSDIDIDDVPALFAHQRYGQLQHFHRVSSTICSVGIRKQSAYVALCGSTKDCIGKCMTNSVGIGMSNTVYVGRYIDAANT